MKSFSFLRTRFIFVLWLVILIAAAVLSLGFPSIYFSVADQAEFSALDIQSTGINEQVYVDANNEQVVSMLLDGKFNTVYGDFPGEYVDGQTKVDAGISREEAIEQTRLCLEAFSESSAQTLGKMFEALFLDEWENVELLAFQELAGVGVYENTVLTANVYMAVISKEVTADSIPTTLTVTFDPISMTVYSFSLSPLKWKVSEYAVLEQGLREYELVYLGLNPLDFDVESDEDKMNVYSSSEGSFLPSIQSEYRFFLYPISIYFDGYLLSVNENR